MFAPCPRADELFNQAISSPEYKKAEEENKEFLAFLSEKTGTTITLPTIFSLNDVHHIEVCLPVGFIVCKYALCCSWSTTCRNPNGSLPRSLPRFVNCLSSPTCTSMESASRICPSWFDSEGVSEKARKGREEGLKKWDRRVHGLQAQCSKRLSAKCDRSCPVIERITRARTAAGWANSSITHIQLWVPYSFPAGCIREFCICFSTTRRWPHYWPRSETSRGSFEAAFPNTRLLSQSNCGIWLMRGLQCGWVGHNDWAVWSSGSAFATLSLYTRELSMMNTSYPCLHQIDENQLW